MTTNTKYLDYDGDGIVLQVGIITAGRIETTLTTLSGNHSSVIILNNDDLDALIKGLQKAQKARRL